MSRFRVDVGHFKMIAEYYNRRCPCWGGKHFCPCPPFIETQKCRCGAVRNLDDPKAQKAKYKTFTVSFNRLTEILKNDYVCPQGGVRCFCKVFLETGKCELNLFEECE